MWNIFDRAFHQAQVTKTNATHASLSKIQGVTDYGWFSRSIEIIPHLPPRTRQCHIEGSFTRPKTRSC